MSLCRYSFEPCKIALLITGRKAKLVPYEDEDCIDYKTWRQADIGLKEESTQLNNHDIEKITGLIGPARTEAFFNKRFIKSGNIFFNND